MIESIQEQCIRKTKEWRYLGVAGKVHPLPAANTEEKNAQFNHLITSMVIAEMKKKNSGFFCSSRNIRLGSV